MYALTKGENFIHACTHTDLTRRNLDVDEKRYLVGRGVVSEIQSNMGKYIILLLCWHFVVCVLFNLRGEGGKVDMPLNL